METLKRKEAAPGYRDLHRALAAARGGAWWRAFGRGFVRALGAAGAGFGLAIVTVMLWPASWAGPVFSAVFAVLLVAVLAVFLVVPLMRVPSLARFTRQIDERYAAGERNEFLSAFDLGRSPVHRGTSPALVEALVEERLEAARRVDLGAPGRRPLGRRWVMLAGIAGSLLALLAATAPGRFAAATRELAHPRLPFAVPVTIEVLTGNVRVEQGTDVIVSARVSGSGEVEPVLEARRGAGVWRSFQAEPAAAEPAAEPRATEASTPGDSISLATSSLATSSPATSTSTIRRFVIPAVESETHYRVAAGGATSPEYLIRVLEPLRILGFQFEYRYPDYSGLKTETVQSTDGSVAALMGTEVTVTFDTNQPLKGGQLELASGHQAKVAVVGSARGRATFRIVRETSYSLVLERERERRGGSPRAGETRLGPYRVTPALDREPLVAVLRPGADTDVPADMRVPLTVHAADDYGLASLHLAYTAEGSEPARQRLVRFTGYPREATETYVWNLSGLKLMPGDLVTYYVEVYDNDTVTGPKSARSRVYTLRLPTLTDLYTEVEEEHREAKVGLEQVREEGIDLKQELERIAREMNKFPISKWEDKQEVAQAFARQQEIREELEQLADNLGESLAKLDNQNLVDEAVLEKVLEIQKLMEQITDPELQEAFKRLGEKLSQLDQNEVQKALRDLALTHEELLRNLEKTIEMLRQLELEEKMERAIQETEELTARQDHINEDLERLENQDQGSNPDQGEENAPQAAEDEATKPGETAGKDEEELSRLSQEEEEGIKDAAELAKLLDEMARQLEEMNQEASKGIERLAEQSDAESPMQSEMQSARQQMAGGKPQGAKKSGRKASQNMRSLLEQLRMQQQAMMNAEMAELAEKLREAAHELLKVSNQEEELIGQEVAVDPQQLAEDQLRLLEATRRVNQLIEEIARTSVMMGTDFAGILGQPMRSMENSTSSFERGNVASGRMHGYQALAQVNEAILNLLGAEQECSGGGSCSSMKTAMQKMMGLSQSQQQVNEGTRQLMGEGAQTRLSESAQQRLSRLAAQQAAIQKGVEEVAQTLEGRRDVLGRMGELASEMEEVAEEMERSQLDDRVLSRQHQILSRLLDAQRSVRQRDLGRERISRAGEQGLGPDELRALPAELLSRRERLEADILRGRSDPYPPSFRELVERYFRALVKVPADGQASPN